MSLKPFRANRFLHAKMEHVELLVVVEMHAWLSPLGVVGGREEGEQERPPDIHQNEKRLQFQTTVTKGRKSLENMRE